MGSRALVAYQRENGQWDCHYSHWGAADLRLEQPLADGLQPGESAGELESAPVRHNGLTVESDVWGTADSPADIVADQLERSNFEALYLVPAIGEVEAYLYLTPKRPRDAEPIRSGCLVQPRAVDGRRLTTAAAARWNGWNDTLAADLQRGDIDRETFVERLNKRAFSLWGKPSRSAEVPGFSPLGSTPRRGLVSISDKIADAERRAVNPNR